MSLYEEIKQDHLLRTFSMTRGAFCSCDRAFYTWEYHKEEHEAHLIAEFENALRAQIAADIRAVTNGPTDWDDGYYEGRHDAARIAEEGNTK